MTRVVLSLALMIAAGCASEPRGDCPSGDLTCAPTATGKEDGFAMVPDCRDVNVGDIVAREHDPNAPYQCVVSPALSRSSQPTNGWIDSLVDANVRQRPFRSVVNLRETWFNDEAGEVWRVGMTADNIPVDDGFTPSYQQVIDFMWFVNDPAHQPALVHCLAGQGRTGTFTALYRMIVQGWNPNDAIDEAHRFLVNDRQIAWLWDFANNHLNDSSFTGFRNAAGSN